MTSVFHGDRPINHPDEDRFGLGDIAGRLAAALLEQSASKGFVLGVEGAWGSGKSSLLALMLDRLRRDGAEAVEIVEFRPWAGRRPRPPAICFLRGPIEGDSRRRARGGGRHAGHRNRDQGRRWSGAALRPPSRIGGQASRAGGAGDAGDGDRRRGDREGGRGGRRRGGRADTRGAEGRVGLARWRSSGDA